MASKLPVLSAAARQEFGKGPSRRLRRDGRVPGVIYAANQETIHIHVDRLELTALVRANGTNAVLQADVEGEKHLVMIKVIDQNVITLNIDHIDFLAIERGERVEVEVPLIYTGEPAPGGMLVPDLDVLRVEADALEVPEEFEISVEGKEIGTQVTTAEIELPEGVTLAEDPEALVYTINVPDDLSVEEDEESEDAAADAEAPETE